MFALTAHAGGFPLPPVVKFVYGRGRSYSTCETREMGWGPPRGSVGQRVWKCGALVWEGVKQTCAA